MHSTYFVQHILEQTRHIRITVYIRVQHSDLGGYIFKRRWRTPENRSQLLESH